MSTAHRHTPRRVTRHPAARPSALLMRLLAPIDGWLRAWWQRRVDAFQQWRRRSRDVAPDTGERLTFETLEPRVLLSAEINPAAQALLAASSASLFTAASEPTINLTPWVDADGTAVSLDISGPGTAQLAADGDGFALRVANSDATTQITLRASGGDGRIALTGIDVTGNVGNLNLASADLSGHASFGGKLGSLILGDIANAQIDVAGSGDLTLQAGKITDSQFRAPLANLALVAGNWLSTSPGAGRLELAALRSLTTTGDFSADLQVSGQGVTGYALGTVQVGGAISDGVWSIHGRGSSLQAGRTGSAWRANFSNTLVQFATRGDASGSLAVAALQLLQIGGSARGLTLLVGADLGDDAALGGSGPAADTFKAGTLARVRITGSLIDSRLLAGLDPANGVLGDGDDRQLGSTTQHLQEFIVGGLVSGSTVVAPAFPSTVRIGGANLSPGSLAPVFARTLADTVAPVLDVRLQSDTGSAPDDGLTRQPALFVHLIEAGSVAAIEARFDDSGDFRAVAASLQGDGSYLIDTPALASLRGGTLPDGAYTLALRARDAAGNVAAPVSVSFTLDTTAPTLSELGLAPASDTGTLGDRSTTAEMVTLTGRAAPGVTVRLTQGDRTTTADASGAFSFADVALALGNNAFDFTASDAAGNTATAGLSVERTAIDSTAPTLTAALANDTGTSSTDSITKDPTITGQAGDNVAVSQLLVAVDPTGTPSFTDLISLLQPDGSFSLSAAQLASLAGGTLAEGLHDVLIRVVDAAGNAISKTVSFTLDTAAPTLSELGLAPASDTGALGDRSTTAEVVTLTGQAAPGATVRLTQGDRITTADPSGAFSFADVALALGNNAFDFTATDAAGNAATASLSVERTAIDSTAPTLTAALANDTGTSSTDTITKDPTITGQAGDNVAVSQLLVALDPTGTPSFTDLTSLLQPDGSFSLSATQLASLAGGTLAEGAHDVLIRAVDVAGNATTRTVSFTHDTTASTLSELGLAPASDTGALGDRSTTADTVTLIGQTAPGVNVRLTQGDRTATADASGAFSFADVALALGNNAFDFTATDAAGNTATATLSVERTAIAVDSTAPTLTAALANDTGISSIDTITQDPTIIAQAGDNVAVSQLLVAVDPTGTPSFTDLTSLLQPDGSFTLSAAQLASLAGAKLAEGAHDVLIRAVDAAGNAISKTVSFTLDTAAPTLSELGLAPASDTGTLGDRSTTADTVTLIGQAAPGATVRLTQGDRIATADPSGAFSFADVALVLGNNAFDFTATDAAGNIGTGSLSVERTAIVVDSTAPRLTAALANDTGASASDGITKDPTITGQTGDNVAVSQLLVAVDPTGSPGFTDLTSLLQPDGSFSISTAQLTSLAGGTLAEGAHDVLIRAVDAAGNATTKTVSFTLDTTAPGAASFGIATADALAGDDTRTSAGRVVLRGQAPAGTLVTLAAQGLSTVAAQGGTFQLANVALVEGDNDLSLTLADAAGNTRNVSRTLTRVATTHSDAVLDWNTIALQAIQRDVTDPPVATRILAIQSIAVYDTLAAIEGTPAFLVQRSVTGPVSADAAVAEAAYWVLHQLYPAQRSSFDAALATSLTSIADGAAKDNGLALGRSIAEAVLAIRAGDGYQDFVSEDGSTAIGKWRPTGPMYLVADNPQWGSVTPFVLTSGDQFRALPPPALDSAQYAADINEVRSLGSATSVTRTADQTEQALFWADGGGSFTPPGHWEQIAAQVARTQGNSLSANARLFAQLNVALADAAIAAWDTKYAYDAWRPETAIQNADQDGNAATTVDAAWRPLLLTPPHPDYVSGHSTFSAAAASILAATFGDDVAFSTTSATLTGVTRSFTSFSQAADEAGKSRIYGGIHTTFANEAGKAIGVQVADSVLARFKLTADTQAPKVVLDDTRPAANSNVTFSGQLLDNLSGVAGAEYRIDSGELQALAFDSEGKFSVTTAFALDGSADGAHSLTIIARDAAGNIGSALTRRFVLDTRAPEISLTSLAEGDLLSAASRLAGIADGTGSSLVKLAYDLDGGTSRSLVFDSGGGFDELIHLGDLTIGDHTLHLTVQDAAGNAGTLSRSVKLAELAPFTITQVTPADGSSDVGVTYRPQISFSRAVNAGTLNSDSLYATGPDGSKIAATLVPALDGSFAWMFFTNPLPGASQITLHVDGSKIRAAQDGSFLDADGNGSAGGALNVSFTTVSSTTVAGTRLIGKVVDPGPDLLPMTFDDIRRGEDKIIHTADDVFLNPIVHAKVFIVGRPDLVTYTDDHGNFAFDGVPVGDVKVGVDGRTATNAPDGVFWPEMVMDVTLRPGVTNTVMDSMGTTAAQLANQLRTEVYLPRVQTSALQPVSNTVPTTITVDEKSAPDLTDAQRSQLTLSVKPGSAVGADGKVLADVKIGINTVPPELVKDMLPPGVLQHTFDITIQAPGVDVFTEPVEITFPNVFDAAPGTKLNILSFDHTTGRLVINGTATVSADGKTVTSDEGSGVRAPGWHGLRPPGGEAETPPPPCPAEPAVPDVDDGADAKRELLALLTGDQPVLTTKDGRSLTNYTVAAPGLGKVKTITISIDSELSKVLDWADGNAINSGRRQETISGIESFTFGIKSKSYSELEKLKPLNEYAVYGGVITIREVTSTGGDHAPDGMCEPTTPDDVQVQKFFVYRYVNPITSFDSKREVRQDVIYINDVLTDGNKSQSAKISSYLSSEAEIKSVEASGPVHDPSAYSVTMPLHGPMVVNFDPSVPGASIGLLRLTPRNADGDLAIWLSAAGTTPQKIYLNLGLDQFSRPPEMRNQQTLLGKLSNLTAKPAYTIKSGNEDLVVNMEVDTGRSAIVNDIFNEFRTYFSSVSGDLIFDVGSGTDGITFDYSTDFNPPDAKGISDHNILGQSQSSIDNIKVIIKIIDSKISVPNQNVAYNFVQAINDTREGTVAVYLPAAVEALDWTQRGGPLRTATTQFVERLALTMAHEAGHTLGLVHADYFDNPKDHNVINSQDKSDVMSYTPLYKGLLEGFAKRDFAFRVSLGALKLGLDEPVESTVGVSAITYYNNWLFNSHEIGPKEKLLEVDGAPVDTQPLPILPLKAFALLTADGTNPVVVSSLDFGTRFVDERPETQQIKIYNYGTEEIHIKEVVIKGGQGFSVEQENAADAVLMPGEGKLLTIKFSARLGESHARLLIKTDASTPDASIDLSGTGTRSGPALVLAATENNLGGVQIGKSSRPVGVATIYNYGTSSLSITGIKVLDGGESFAISGVSADLDGHPITVAPGGSYDVSIVYTPSHLWLERGTIEINSDDPVNSSARFGVVGTGALPSSVGQWGNDEVAIEFPSLGDAATIRVKSDDRGNFSASLPEATPYRITVFDPVSGLVAHGQGVTAASGRPTKLTSTLTFMASTAPDTDFDGLPDDIEFSIGTSETAQDSDGDGVSDFAEMSVDSNPLDSRFAATAILAGLSLQGQAKAISADQSAGTNNPVVAVASGTHGIALVDVSSPNKPLLLREVDLAGDSTDVAFDGTLGIAAVASNGGGLNLVDLAGTVRNIAINASSVEVADGIAYANNGGQLRAYDLLTGERLQTLALGVSPIVSMAREGQMLYTVDAAHTLRAIDLSSGQMVARGSLLLPTAAAKLSVGGGIAYIGAGNGGTAGFMTAKVTNPDALTLLSGVDSNSIAGTAIAATGSGIGVAVGSSSFVVGGFRALDLLDLSDPTNTAGFLRRINLPQVPYDVSIAAGLAFVADGTGGLQVVNYRAFDNRGVAPTVGATTSLIDVDPIKPGLQVQEGGRVVVSPTVTDDVQVRNVELLVGGKVVRNDLSFPFDLSGALPTIAANGGTNVTLQVRATDTGGNFGLSAPIEVELVPDTFGPHLLGSSLKDGSTVGRGFRAVTLDFSESIDPLTLGANAIQIVDADGTAVNPDNLQFRRDGRQLHATFAPLAVGAYTLRIDTAQVRDRAGNAVGASTIDTRFTVKQFSVEWINPAGGDWNTAANWSTGVVPLASDDVFIGLPENVTVTISGGTVKVASLVSNENLVLAGGTLTISGEARIDGSFRMSAGTLNGTGTVLLAGTGNQWSGGAMSGGGTTRIGLGADLVVTGDNLKSLGDRTLVNEGTLIDESTAARVELDGVIAFNNNGLFDIRGNQAWRNTAGPAAMTLNNTGTMRKSAGTGVFLFTNTVLNNAGTVDAQAGRLVFSGGGGASSGAFMTSAGAAIELEGGTQTWLAGAHATGPGAIVVGRANTSIDGTLSINGDVSAARLDLNFGGTLTGSGTLTITGTGSQWSAGVMTGGGTTRIAPTADLSLTGAARKTLVNRRIINEGTLIDAQTAGGYVELDGSGVLDNAGLFDIRGDQSWENYLSLAGTLTLNNSGTLRKSLGAGDFQFLNTALNNTGTVDVRTGRLAFGGDGGVSTGNFTTAAGTAIVFQTGTQTWQSGAKASGSGAIELGSLGIEVGKLAVEGSAEANRLDIIAGTLTGAGTLTLTGLGSQWTGGSMTGGGTTRLAAAAELTVGGSQRKTLGNRRIQNEGTLIDAQTAGGYVDLDGSGVLDNTGLFDIRGDQSWENYLSPAGTLTLNNSGILRKSAGPGDFVFSNVSFTNAGTVTVLSGILKVGSVTYTT